ncbi:hypothetical protein B0H10DRAFT_547327 [Mycena sp. CBHHK59/15]|nr:hypothetical protein B0H10DRAFT_547327 [Mycena sp. CBHHK59/15]
MEPPVAASIGQACYKCLKEENTTLSKCSRCLRVAYCSPECQRADWPTHKSVCSILNAVEKDLDPKLLLPIFAHANDPYDPESADRLALNYGSMLLTSTVRRRGLSGLTKAEERLISLEPKCLVCARSNYILRIGVRTSRTGPGSLTPCADCKTSFCCCVEHWNDARAGHLESHDGDLSQCEINQQIRAHGRLWSSGVGLSIYDAQWIPKRLKTGWVALTKDLEASRWEREFAVEIRAAFSLSARDTIGPYLWTASEHLSMPMTVLYALQEVNESDAWTRNETLVIHILGSFALELLGERVFEEILHRLPNVKKLQIVFCGPELRSPDLLNLNTRITRLIAIKTFGPNLCCTSCRQSRREMRTMYCAELYHHFVEAQGSQFKTPDLAIAFNSGLSQESQETWPKTFKCLVERRIATVFTAYDSEEAVGDAACLRAAGARLLPSLGPRKNPWGSMVAKIQPGRLRGFYHESGWLAGGFR